MPSLSAASGPGVLRWAADRTLLRWCQMIDDGEILRAPGVQAFRSRTGSLAGSLLVGRLGRGGGAQLDAAVAFLRASRGGDIICWPLDPPQPRHLGAMLLARGFEANWQSNWMALDLSSAQLDAPPPPRLQIIVADDEGEIPDQEAEDVPYYARHQAIQIVRAGLRSRGAVRQIIGLFDGQVVAQSALQLAGRLAIIRNVGVTPTMRRRGYGRALTLAALRIAAGAGATLAMLSATDEGQQLYMPMGFRPIGRTPTWVLRRSTMDLPPAPPALRDLAEAAGAGDLPRLAALAAQSPDLVDAALPSQLTPLRVAAELRQPAAVDWLSMNGAQLDLLTAWRLGWRERAATLLRAQPGLADQRSGPWQLTPLHIAVWEHDLALAQLLLSAAPDLTVRDTAFSSTPLGWAEHFQRSDMVALIRAHQDRGSQV